MNEWTISSGLASASLLAAAWLLHRALRPLKDYYVLQRLYFERLHEPPWRGALAAAFYEGFADYLPGKAYFEDWENLAVDTAQQEAEHILFMIPARSKAAARDLLRAGKADGKTILHRTLLSSILDRREYWQKIAASNEAVQQTAPSLAN
ncbi:MAG: hypothetical protein ABSC06_00580 [Rhodopila sp.]|jgi:hypothetical protein